VSIFVFLALLLRAQNGWTALMLSALAGHVDCATLLLEAGADKDAKHTVRFQH
jgi:ankyrin repeat protein